MYGNKIENIGMFKITTGIISIFQHLEKGNYLEELKVRWIKIKVVKMCLI